FLAMPRSAPRRRGTARLGTSGGLRPSTERIANGIECLPRAGRKGRATHGRGAHMCDQDQFEKDRQEYEARGLVTRRQFGVLLGAGMAMMLPGVVDAVAVTEADVTVTTPDGSADCYFVHPASGTAPGVLLWPDI